MLRSRDGFFSGFVPAAALVAAIVAAVNWAGDPAQLFGGDRYEAGIAAALARGDYVAGAANYDDRLVQKYYVEQLDRPKDVLVLGSSRSMQLRAALFPGRTVYNAAVGGGTVEDYLAIYELFHRRGLAPRTLVIGVDPWSFNVQNRAERWQSLADAYDAARARLGLPVAGAAATTGALAQRRWATLFSWDYFVASLAKLADSKPSGTFTARADDRVAAVVRRPDGSLKYPDDVLATPAAEIAAAAGAQGRACGYQAFDNFVRDDGAFAMLAALVGTAQGDGIAVILFLPPYHPAAHAGLQGCGVLPILADIERRLRDLAAESGARVVGSYDPAVTGCDAAAFKDDMHPKETCVEHIFATPE